MPTPDVTSGSNHIRYVCDSITLRLTTDAAITYVLDRTPFLLDRPLHFVLGPDETLRGNIAASVREMHDNTNEYWAEWSRTLSVPFEWQEEVIRAAITLKLCSFEETGAIIAAPTTSIPEAANTSRNWDYRYCWLRDAYFVVHALNRLGATRTMESYLSYISNLVAGADGHLQPVYGIGLEEKLDEREVSSLSGYRGMGPVRVGNQAYQHVQNDVYGSVILAATQSFFDARLRQPGGRDLFEMLEDVGHAAIERWDQPDAGLWELRHTEQVHTFSSVMCWAACDRLARIAWHIGLDERREFWHDRALHMRAAILERAWSAERGCLVQSFGGHEVDASLLLVNELGFLQAGDPRFASTVAAVEHDLRRGSYLMRYAVADDFGEPSNAFNICTFWYIDALAALGRRTEARDLFENMLAHRNHLGLLSEDLDPRTGELWGNVPQTYSMVGLINSAMRLSRSWEDAL